MTNKPQSFVRPLLDYIDNGNFFRAPFRILYLVIAVASALVPFLALYGIIDSGVFKFAEAGMIIGIVLAWLVMLAGFLVVAVIWWTRADQLRDLAPSGDEYPVTPVFVHFLRTSGESGGVIVGGVMFLVLLIMLIFAGSQGGSLLSSVPGLAGGSWATVFMMPVIGFLIVLFSRFLSEQIRALVNIAQNTKK
ncbi:MAG: hypothetical protein LBV18_05020 [Alistipes sp.]|jgi:hypothetical protein|nr:hypothetical protein [Alistipes sp.]